MNELSAMTLYTGPITPLSTISRIFTLMGRYLVHTASIKNTPFALAASASFRVCAAVTVNGFSQRTCFPASMASMAFWKWWLCGVAT